MTVNNFASIGEGVVLEFTPGTYFVKGDNRDDPSADSNGAGKSSLFDAVCWCLFGQTTKSKGRCGDEVVNRKSGEDGKRENCSVAITLNRDGVEVQVIRFRLHKKYKDGLAFFIGGEDARGRDNLETQRKIIQYLGMDFDIFSRTVFCPQNQSSSIAEMTDSEAKEFFDKFLGLQRWAEPLPIVKRDLKALRESVVRLDAEDEMFKMARVGQLARRRESGEKMREHDHRIAQAVDELKRGIEKQTEAIKQTREALQALDVKKNEARAARRLIVIADIKKLNEGVGEAKARDAERVRLAAKIKRDLLTVGFREPKADMKAQLEEAEQSEQDRKGRVFVLSGKVATAKSAMQTHRKAVDDLARAQRGLDAVNAPGSLCPACGQVMGQDARDKAIDKARAEVEHLSKHVGEPPEGFDALERELSEIEREARVHDRDAINIRQRIGALEQVEADETRLKELNAFADDLTETTVIITDRQRELDDLDADIFTFTNDHARLNRELLSLRNEVDRRTREMNRVAKEVNPWGEVVAQCEKEIAELNESRVRLDKEKDAVAVMIAKAEFWERAFSSSGIRNMLLDEVMPSLNAFSDIFSAKISDGTIRVTFTNKMETKKGEIREKFGVIVDNFYGGDTFSLNSGGEATKVNMIVLFALQKFNQSRSDRVNLSIYDETFHSLDGSGRDRIVSVIKEEAHDKCVFVVSHDESLAGSIPCSITMIKENGMSYLER
jgi:DNA repair exonuclease SbcCD ATPase subunit